MDLTVPIHHGHVTCTPEEAGYRAEKLTELNSHFERLIHDKKLQGASYLLAKNGKVFAHTALGKLRHAESNLSSADLLPSSIRKTYSITKVFTAVAIIRLIDQGLIYLNQSVSSILPEFDTAMHKDITIFHLLTHTSGLRGDNGFYTEPYPLPWFEQLAKDAKNINMNWKQVILAGTPFNERDKEWIYSTSGYAVLGEIIAITTGKRYEDYIMEEIIQPLHMTNSFFELPIERADETVATDEWEEKHLYKSSTITDGAIPKAGNGLFSTLEDLFQFAQMMLNGGHIHGNRILSKRAVELQTKNHLNGVLHQGWGNHFTNYEYGLGWSLEHFDICSKGTFSHEGYGHSGIFIDSVEQFIYIFFVPSELGYLAESVVTPRAIVWSGLK